VDGRCQLCGSHLTLFFSLVYSSQIIRRCGIHLPRFLRHYELNQVAWQRQHASCSAWQFSPHLDLIRLGIALTKEQPLAWRQKQHQQQKQQQQDNSASDLDYSLPIASS
jgi:hypothetical protein